MAAAAVVGVLVAGADLRVEAQGPGRPFAQRPFLPLVDDGSTIGVSVRDGDAGVVIEEVRRDSPAARAGLMTGDIVVEFDGERTRSAIQFTRLVRETAPGRTVRIRVIRDGSARTLDVTPDGRGADDLTFPNITRDVWPRNFPRDFAFDFEFTPGVAWFGPRRLGASVSPLTDQLAKYFGVERGVLVSEVTSGSVAEAAGIKAGDVIIAIAGRTVSSPGDLAREVRQADAGTNVEVRVMRERKEVTLTAKMPERPDGRRPLRGVRTL